MYKGYYSRNKYGASAYGDPGFGEVAYPTVSPARLEQDALEVLAHLFVREVGTDTSESASADWQIAATAHAAQRGDVIRLTSGSHAGREIPVVHTSANVIYIADKLNVGNGIDFQILRHKRPLVQADGTLVTSATLSPFNVQFDRNGTDTEVLEDTGTPANSRPLPVKIFGTTGSPIDAATAAKQDTIIGHVDGIEALLSTIDGRVDGIEALLTSLDGKDFATQTTLAALLTELGQKADLTDTQPVSVASLPLPTGAATAANQSTIIGHVDGIESLLSTIDGRVDGLEALLTSIDGKLPSTLGQKAMAASLAVVLASDQSSIPVAATQSGNWSTRGQDGSGNALTSEAVGSNRGLHVVDLPPDVVDFLDTNPVLDASSTNIPASASNPVEVVASLAAAVRKIRVNDTTGEFIGVYTGAALSEVLQCIIGPGLDGEIPVRMAASERVSLRNMANAAISTGKLCIQFLG